MTNEQLFLAIAALFIGLMFMALLLYVNARFHSVEQHLGSVEQRFLSIDQRLDGQRDFWLAEFHRFEEAIDARLKHLEER